MQTKIAKQITYWLGVAAVGLVVGLSVQFVLAWTEPTVAPPGGNVGAPINTSGFGQTKVGALILNCGTGVNCVFNGSSATNGLLVPNGNVSIGTTNSGSSVFPFTSNSLYLKGITGDDGTMVIDTTDSAGIDCDAGITMAKAGTGKWWMGNDCAQPDSFAIWDIDDSTGRLYIKQNGNVGIGTTSPQSRLHVADGGYLQAGDNNTGAPPAADCDAAAELGRISIDTTNNRLYICMGAARLWDYINLTD